MGVNSNNPESFNMLKAPLGDRFDEETQVMPCSEVAPGALPFRVTCVWHLIQVGWGGGLAWGPDSLLLSVLSLDCSASDPDQLLHVQRVLCVDAPPVDWPSDLHPVRLTWRDIPSTGCSPVNLPIKRTDLK